MAAKPVDRWSINKSVEEFVLDSMMFRRTKNAIELGRQLASDRAGISIGECDRLSKAILMLDPFYGSWVHEFAEHHEFSDDLAIAALVAIATHVDSDGGLSSGERAVKNYLDGRGMKFTTQKSFQDLRHVGLLRFDFFLDDHNIAIEYNGRQHYQPVEYFGGDAAFADSVQRDNAKQEWCRSNGVDLVVVRYDCCVKSYLDEVLSGLL